MEVYNDKTNKIVKAMAPIPSAGPTYAFANCGVIIKKNIKIICILCFLNFG